MKKIVNLFEEPRKSKRVPRIGDEIHCSFSSGGGQVYEVVAVTRTHIFLIWDRWNDEPAEVKSVSIKDYLESNKWL